ncbi:hypothetical protein M8Z33_07520 [Streptomyces sp. ZAF1911]|uniref:hypothetical protein n=1 Tax=Streptomyces sp. ZAF1911 TaxID=2944129 RepID=UPI00237BCE7A|nr:hypothetical protein [Streptomyces sp. ZAF1911]MDD9376523.1 hypothetical protein [Streptomyces sp. ZAF1911]
MHSIRTYDGEIRLCLDCGHPCHSDGVYGPEHFHEQWDGQHCDVFPMARTRGEVGGWTMSAPLPQFPLTLKFGDFGMVGDGGSEVYASLEALKAAYPDTYPN